MDEENNPDFSIEEDQPIDIIQMQQNFYQLFGYGSHLIYDCHPSKVFVEQKVEILCPCLDEINKKHLIDMLWMQRSHRGGNNQLLMSTLFICVVYDSDLKNGHRLTYPLDIKSKKISVHPIFRIQKCSGIATVDENGQNKCCAIFVDDFGRVYKNWEDFLKNGKYKDGIMVAPKRGIYNGSPATGQVLLDIVRRNSGVTKVFDTGSTAVGLASAVVTTVALIPAVTIAPVVLGVAVGAGITSAVYTGARSVYRLYDRKTHKQSIGLKNSEARNAWLNVGVGAVSVGAAGATQVLARAARNGRNISALARNSVCAVNIAAVTMTAGACADDSFSLIYQLIKDGTLSKQHAAQLLFDLFLLRHSINNFHTVKQIMANSESGPINEVLSESQRESFQNLIGRTGDVCGSAVAAVGRPIVRSLKVSLTDPRVCMDLFEMILKQAQNVEISIEDMFKGFCGIVAPPIAREYCRKFDEIINKIAQELGRKLKIKEFNSILRPLINWLREITFKACNKILDFLQQLVIEMAQAVSINFVRMLKKLHIELKQQSAIEHSDLNSFILSKRDDDLRKSVYGEGETIEKLEQIDAIYDEAYGSTGRDLDENRKLELLIDEYATEYAEEFIKCSPATSTNELYEIIVQILQKLPYDEAQIFFELAKYLITKHAENIQKSLGRFLSVDIFIVDLYCLLTEFSCKNNYESLSEFLSKYVQMSKDVIYPAIEDEFKQFYVIKDDPSLKKIRCSTCGGEVFV